MEKTKFDLDTISIDKNIDLKNEVDRILENGISKKDIVIAKKNIRIAIIAVTEKGKNTAEKIASELENVDVFFQKRGIKELTGELFNKYECIIFVSACGIAVRCIAHFLKSKFEDPAVLVVDDNGNNVISLLSGHIGGANEITLKIADILNANPVITTSTDTNKKGALDVIVSKIGGYVENLRESAKLVNSYLVDDKRVGIYFDSDYESEKDSLNLSGFELIDEKTEIDEIVKLDALVSVTDKLRCWIDEIVYNIKKDNEEKEDLIYIKLVPRRIALGMGCRKNTETEKMIEEFSTFSALKNIHPAAIVKTGSLIIKKDEKCMIDLSKALCAEFNLFDVDEICTCDYMFDKSEFVKKNTGVYSVAQPSAYLLSGNVISDKYKNNGTTFAFGRMKG
ncbi:cobalt-precorrin 5A hydrolase [Peptoclostridium sp. AF21-18]|uniref:cobalt-precorrin 5A hydrolase n=1 Tax=Peptoclostridium sp. AF21-18 TaxID=2292243 RepID=UPI000E529601|nr:cobalt-precorrin 5A hydrolase [Peptoclostridium sp. AF21-18]RHQ98897.1 cobalt-precorrin 5A hydrolase [Peptoclostridium sp. AF21-18]